MQSTVKTERTTEPRTEPRTEPAPEATADRRIHQRTTNGGAVPDTNGVAGTGGVADSERSASPTARASWVERSLKALASRRRLQILEWLKDPSAHFPPQEHGDPIEHGACNMYITDKLGVSQPAASRHMKVLVEAGLVIATPRSGYVYYRRDEQAIHRLTSALATI